MDFPAATLGGGDERFNGQHDTAEIGQARIGAQDGKPIDTADTLAAVDQHGVVLASLNHPVGHLLLEGFGDVSCAENVFC